MEKEMLNLNKRTVTAIILAAGNSTRFGKNRNKNFERINGKSVLSYSLKTFDENKYVDNIIIAAKEIEKKEIKNIILEEHIKKNTKIIVGGNTRSESVYNCIRATDSDIVIIQDGARPFIKQEYIDKCIENMNYYKGVTVGVKSKDTIKLANESNIVVSTTKRNNTWIIQTPQCFIRDILLKEYEKYKNEDVTDDCEILEKGNYKIKIIKGDYTNIKITTYEDLDIVKKFLEYVPNQHTSV